MEINGLPAHVLIVHAAVVFLPLAAASALVFAGVPKWRWATRYPTIALSLMGLGAVTAAYFSGKNFRDKLENAEALGSSADEVASHAERAEVLVWVAVVFVVVVLIAAWGLGGPSALASGRGERARHAPVMEWFLVAMVAMLAVSLMAMTVYTGDKGSRAVWQDTWEFVK